MAVQEQARPQAAPAPPPPVPEIMIRPSRGWIALQLRDLWAYRELLYFLVWRDIKVRYKQTVLGAAWAIIQPVLTMVAFTIFFGRTGAAPSDGVPYPIFTYAALVPWQFFAGGLSQAAASLVTDSRLITKIYFPRLAIPIATVLAGVLDFCLAFVVLIGLMLYYGLAPSANLIWLPALLLLTCGATLGVGLWLSTMNVQFRDVRYTIPFLVQFWLLATPIAYPSSGFAEPWRSLYALNPMVGVVEGFRWALLGADSRPAGVILTSALSALLLLVSGAYYFRRMEKTFADLV